MTWAAFFKSRPIAYGSVAGALGLTAGAAGSVFFVSLVTAMCSSLSNVLSELSDTVAIPELKGAIVYNNFSKTITVNDIIISLPTSVTDFINDADHLPDYCYYGSLTVAVGTVIASSVVLATFVALMVLISDEHMKTQGMQKQTSFNKNFSFSNTDDYDYARLNA